MKNSCGTYSINSQIKFKTSILKSSICDYSNAYIIFKGNIGVLTTLTTDAAANNANEKVIIKNCAPFIDCINKISNTQVDNAKDIDVVTLMYI